MMLPISSSQSSIKRHLDRSPRSLRTQWRDPRIWLLSLTLLLPVATAQTPNAPEPQVPAITSYTPTPHPATPPTTEASPTRSNPTGLRPEFLGFLGPYHRPVVPPLFPGTGTRL